MTDFSHNDQCRDTMTKRYNSSFLHPTSSLFDRLAGNELFWVDKGDRAVWRWVK